MNTGKKILLFGREPAFFIGVIEAALVLLVVFGLGLNAERSSLIMAVVTALFGLYGAWLTQDAWLGYAVGLAKAALALAVGFGLTLTAEQTAALIAFITIFLSGWQRGQTSPSFFPKSPSPDQVVVVDSAKIEGVENADAHQG